MSMACRHCHGRDEFSTPSVPEDKPAEVPSYMERLVYGNEDMEDTQLIQRVLEWVEGKATGYACPQQNPVPMPGTVIWCPACHRMSVISYKYHCFLLERRGSIPVPSKSAYYTRLCISAEMWMHMLDMQIQQQAPALP